MKLKGIGEFGLIRKIAKVTKTSPSVIKGIGDDCAVLRHTKDKYILVTADMIIEDVHFRLKEATPQQIGRKAIAANISDIAACGGIGKWAVVSVGLSKDADLNFVNKIYAGIQKLASEFKIDIIGGDTNLSKKAVISVAIIGEVNKKNLVLRSGAKVNDVIFLTGKLSSRMRDLSFTPRIKEASILVNNFKINSMIDISDGLLSDLGHIISSSGTGACLYESLIPYQASSVKRALASGEQFELLFTANKSTAKRLLAQAVKKRIKISAIGEITGNRNKIILVDKRGRREELKPGGYRHF